MPHIVEVDGTASMQKDPLLDIQNIWLFSETCFDAVFSLRVPDIPRLPVCLDIQFTW